MTKNKVGRLVGIPRRILIAALALTVPLALGVASPALAVPHGDFAPFADCPLSSSPIFCLVASTSSGEFTVGTTTVPINKTITLQGGIGENSSGEFVFIGAADGNTLSKTALAVPGGLLGIVAPSSWPGWLQAIFNNFINEGLTGVTATTELAAPASSISINFDALLTGSGTGLNLPVKVKLSNPFLGNECYIGSNAHPIELPLTDGSTSPPLPNHPISGSVGTPEVKDEGNLVVLNGNSLVNNSFAAPEASGCGGIFSFLVDPVVDLKLGLPSAAGHNTAVLTGKNELAVAEAVRASE